MTVLVLKGTISQLPSVKFIPSIQYLSKQNYIHPKWSLAFITHMQVSKPS